MTRKALVIGHTGQDGTYLLKLLQDNGYESYGISSSSVYSSTGTEFNLGDLSDATYSSALLESLRPDLLFYLAAKHQSSIEVSYDDLPFFKETLKVNAENYMNLLNAVKMLGLQTKCFYASSSHVFAGTNSNIQDESTPLQPVSIYGVSKVLGMQLSDLYREKGVHCAVGIFYNHESPLRASKFVSKKIVETAVAIKLGKSNELVLGSLDAVIDWGYAPDYMQAALLILEKGKPENYVVSSGKLHTVRDFVAKVFEELSLDWNAYVRLNNSILLKKSTNVLLGNNEKLRNDTNWSPSVSFDEMISILVKAELDAQNGIS